MSGPRDSTVLTEIQQLEAITHPLDTVKSGINFADLAFIKTVVSDATVVGLGEVTHGISEMFQMKHRLLEYLVKEMDFSIFSIEANMPEAYRINDYVLHGKGNPQDLIKGMNLWTWNTQEVFDMVEWMRNYNKTAAKKVQFTGFDMQPVTLPAEIIQKNLENEEMHNKINKLAGFLKQLKNDYYNNCNYTPPEIEANRAAIQKDSRYHEIQNEIISVQNYLLQNESQLVNKLGKPGYEWTQQNLELLKQNAKALVKPLAARDQAMADNVMWIQKQNPGAKMVLWAHNSHVHKQGFEGGWYKFMGEYLANVLKDKYRVIGFVAHGGTYTAKDLDDNKLKRDLVLHTPPENSLESKMKQLSNSRKLADGVSEEALLFLNLRDSNKPQWLLEPVTARLGLGSVKEPDVESSFGLYNVSAGYDGIIYVEKTHGTQPIQQKNLSANVGIFKTSEEGLSNQGQSHTKDNASPPSNKKI